MIELEKTFLLKQLPVDFDATNYKEIYDMYIVGDDSQHPILRVRKNGSNYEITKKYPVENGDSSKQIENTIAISEAEFNELIKFEDGRKVRKYRYIYERDGERFEFDVFQDGLLGLVLVDIEFETEDQKDVFVQPDFALVDVTQEKTFAGGMLAGKNYGDIEEKLTYFGYQKILV